MTARAPSPGFKYLRRRAIKREARTFVDLLLGMLDDAALQDAVERMLGSSSGTKNHRSDIADRLVTLAHSAVPDPAAWATILAEHLLRVSLADPAANAILVDREECARAEMRQWTAPGKPHLRVVVAERPKPETP